MNDTVAAMVVRFNLHNDSIRQAAKAVGASHYAECLAHNQSEDNCRSRLRINLDSALHFTIKGEIEREVANRTDSLCRAGYARAISQALCRWTSVAGVSPTSTVLFVWPEDTAASARLCANRFPLRTNRARADSLARLIVSRHDLDSAIKQNVEILRPLISADTLFAKLRSLSRVNDTVIRALSDSVDRSNIDAWLATLLTNDPLLTRLRDSATSATSILALIDAVLLSDPAAAGRSDTAAHALRNNCERIRQINLDSARTFREVHDWTQTDVWMPWRRSDLLPLYRDGAQVFSGFGVSASDKDVVVLTDVLSGTTGFLPFGITHIKVLSSDSQQVAPSRQHVLQLLDNGGVLTAHAQYPFWARGSDNVRLSTSIYAQAGMFGSLSADSMRPSLAEVFEVVSGFTVRRPQDAAFVADLILAARTGHVQAFGSPIDAAIDSEFWFCQIGIGVQQAGTLRLSLLINEVLNDRDRPYVPEIAISLAALH